MSSVICLISPKRIKFRIRIKYEAEETPQYSYLLLNLNVKTTPKQKNYFTITSKKFITTFFVISCSVVCDSLRPHRLSPARLLCPWNFPGKDTGAGCHFLLQGTFPTQRLNPHLLHWQKIFHLNDMKCHHYSLIMLTLMALSV